MAQTPVPGGAGQDRADLDRRDAGFEQSIDRGVTEIVATLDDDGAVRVDCIGRQGTGVRAGLHVSIADHRAVGLLLGDRGDDSALCSTVDLADDDVLRNVHQTTGQVTRVGGAECGIGQTLTSTVRVLMKYSRTVRPSLKEDLIGRGMNSPFGFVTRPFIPASERT